MKTCYMCDKPGKTKEHVPPECFFPKQADIPKGLDFRKNLITVRSCDDHNLRKSGDDEYLKMVIASHWQNNQAGYEYSMAPVKRSIQLKEKQGLWRNFLEKAKNDEFVSSEGEQLVSINIDVARFNSELEKIARGIYFYQFKQKVVVSPIIFSRSLVTMIKTQDPKMNALMNDLIRATE